MFDNWDWVSFLVGVGVTVFLGGGGALLIFIFGEDF